MGNKVSFGVGLVGSWFVIGTIESRFRVLFKKMEENILKNKNPIGLRLGQFFLTNGLRSNRSSLYKSL
jgi:hypothetical protein